jgi:hypothetical protein
MLSTDDELRERVARATQAAPVGSTWVHRKGGRYAVADHCILEATNEAAVIYRPEPGGLLLWCRPAAEFLDGRFTREQ